MSTRQSTSCIICGREFQRARGTSSTCGRECHDKARTVSVIDRFFRYVGHKLPSGCIPWTGACNSAGYGVLNVGGKVDRAHRISYEHFVGGVGDLCVLHRCDNPVCINPVHLFLGTRAENMADKVRKGRQPQGEDHGPSVLSENAVRSIRKLFASGKYTPSFLAEVFKVSYQTIIDITRRRTWKHIP